jgi:hypothetical protein
MFPKLLVGTCNTLLLRIHSTNRQSHHWLPCNRRKRILRHLDFPCIVIHFHIDGHLGMFETNLPLSLYSRLGTVVGVVIDLLLGMLGLL